jgi:alpha-1,6-mannosyltransferase
VLAVPGKADADEQTPAGRRVTFASPPLVGSGDYRVLTARRRLLRLLDDVGPDVLEVSDKLSLSWLSAWARAHGVPIVLFSHERIDAMLGARLSTRLPIGALAAPINRRLSALVDTVVVASAFAAAEYVRAGAPNVRRIPLGVDLDTFHPDAAPARTGGGLELILLSRLSTEKNPGLAVDAVRRLWDDGMPVRLTIVGDGPLRRRIERRSAGLPVRFLGHVADRSAVARLVAGADVTISPSSAETFGLATLESLAGGTPIVVPTAGALAELVGGPGSGVACAPTAEAFAAGVRELLAYPRDARRAAARTTAERYPWSQTVDGLLGVYALAGAR